MTFSAEKYKPHHHDVTYSASLISNTYLLDPCCTSRGARASRQPLLEGVVGYINIICSVSQRVGGAGIRKHEMATKVLDTS